MVFWNRFINKIKTSIDKITFLKLEEKVKQNSTSIETVKNQYAKKDITNSFTAKQNLDAGADVRDNLKILNDKQLQLGYTENDIKLKMYCDTGQKHMNIENPQGDIKITTPNGNLFINTRDTMNLGTKRINNLGNPVNDQDAATKKYVDDAKSNVVEQINNVNQDLQTQKAIITNIDDRLDELPNTYLSKVDAQADYARLKEGISNDWYSTQTFNKGVNFKGTTLYIKENILDVREITNKNYVDTEINKAKQYTNTKLISRTLATDASNVVKRFDITANGIRYIRYNYNYGSGVNNIINIYAAEANNPELYFSFTIYNSGWIDFNIMLPTNISQDFYSQFVIKSWG